MASFPPSKKRPRSIITEADHEILAEHYEFVPTESTRTWQERMVQNYHQHLYKEYVLADFTRKPQLGLRWRTQAEVENGRGSITCGNKHCPALPGPFDPREEQQSLDMLHSTNRAAMNKSILRIPYGFLQRNFEVPFTYQERNEQKQELVKLRLCLRCSILLFECRGEKDPTCAVYESWFAKNSNDEAKDSTCGDLSQQHRRDELSSSSSHSSMIERKLSKKSKHRKSSGKKKRRKYAK